MQVAALDAEREIAAHRRSWLWAVIVVALRSQTGDTVV